MTSHKIIGCHPFLCNIYKFTDSLDMNRHKSPCVLTNSNRTLLLFQNILKIFGAASSKYGAAGKFWAMNEKTHMKLVAEAMNFNSAGAIVAGVNSTMPVIGGVIEVLNFIPDNIIIGGYFELYVLGERRGPRFGTSEHVRFLQDQTVMKGVARYDGAPAIAEAFVAVGIGAAPSATAVTFAAGE